MIKESLAQPAHQSTTRVDRGRRLWEEHADEIRFDPAEKVWLVPSQHDGTSVYEVTIGRQGEFCECIDFEIRHPEGGCKHILAATIARAKTATCIGCGGRFRHRDLFDVGEDSLTFFEGDVLCGGCARDHGVL